MLTLMTPVPLGRSIEYRTRKAVTDNYKEISIAQIYLLYLGLSVTTKGQRRIEDCITREQQESLANAKVSARQSCWPKTDVNMKLK